MKGRKRMGKEGWKRCYVEFTASLSRRITMYIPASDQPQWKGHGNPEGAMEPTLGTTQ